MIYQIKNITVGWSSKGLESAVWIDHPEEELQPFLGGQFWAAAASQLVSQELAFEKLEDGRRAVKPQLEGYVEDVEAFGSGAIVRFQLYGGLAKLVVTNRGLYEQILAKKKQPARLVVSWKGEPLCHLLEVVKPRRQ